MINTEDLLANPEHKKRWSPDDVDKEDEFIKRADGWTTAYAVVAVHLKSAGTLLVSDVPEYSCNLSEAIIRLQEERRIKKQDGYYIIRES